MNKIKLLIITVSALLSLHCFSQAPNISYGSNAFSFTTGLPVSPIFPTNTGGAPYAYSQTLTFVGSTTGTAGNSNGTGNSAGLYRPFSLVPDPSGNLYLSDGGNNKIRIISSTGVVTTLAANVSGSTELNYPTGLSRDASGNLYVSEAYGSTISLVTATGTVSRLAGNGTVGYVDGPAASAEFNFPTGTAVDASGNIYVSDWGNHVIRKITPSGTVSTFAGNGTAGYVNGTGTAAAFDHPSGLIFDSKGNLLIADEYNQVIRKITPAGVVTTLSGSGNEGYLNGTSANADFFFPVDVALDAAGNFYVADYGNRIIRKIATDGTVSTLAGTPQTSGLADGVGTAASFNTVEGVTVGTDGNVYVADFGNDNIREIIMGGYSVSQSLPIGLAFDRVSGSISGTPSVVSASTSYSVMARNSFGTSQVAPLNMAVNPPAGFNPSQNQNYITIYTPRLPNVTSNTAVISASGDMNKVAVNVQYFDGLGRPMQTVQVKASPTGRDLVQPITYDAFGREVNKYLPYSATTAGDGSYKTTALADQSSFYTNPASTSWNAPGVVQMPGQDAQATTVYEASPLNRVLEQGAPGADWQPVTGSTAGHTSKIAYITNNTTPLTDTTNSYYVALYKATINSDGSHTLTQGSGTAAYYGAGQLYVTVSYDENWTSGKGGTTEEYKDKEGHVVLKRTFNYIAGTLQILSTYYVYDNVGNLAFVLPPLSGADNAMPSQAMLNNLCYQYNYDDHNRMMTKKLPGKGVEEMVYDQLDQLVFKRDGNERNAGQWEFIKYDSQGRVIITGITQDTSSRAPLQSFVTNMIVLTDTVAQWEIPTSVNGIQGYTDAAFPYGNNQIILKVNYYDDYTFPGAPSTATATGYSSMTRGLLTASKTTVLNTMNNVTPVMLWDVQYYDDLGRETQTYHQHYLGGLLSPYNYDISSNSYDYANFVHELAGTTRQQYVKNTGNTVATLSVTIVNNYKYDQVERKLQTWEGITTGNNVPSTPILLSQSNYNELGQLITKHLHSESSGGSFLQDVPYTYNERGWLTSAGTSNNLFNYTLKYSHPDAGGSSAQYNGNIAEQQYSKTSTGTITDYYSYDALNRLTNASSVDNLSEQVAYDLEGNIKNLTRGGQSYSTLSYNYLVINGSTSNQLGTVIGTGFTARSYDYDPNGNANSDGQGRTITYNLLDLPQTVSQPNNSSTTLASYYYDAAGQKVRNTGSDGYWDYDNGIVYNGTTATNGTIQFIQTEEGRAIPQGSNWDYEYNLKDQLGNVRLSFDKDPTLGTARRVQEDEYYAFGLRSPVYDLSNHNRYLYNGKEVQTDLASQYDYGARFYDPVIGRWTSVDPLTEISRRWSTYNYVENNPIRNIDPDGMWTQDENGFHSDDEAEAQAFFKQIKGQQQGGDKGKKKHNSHSIYIPDPDDAKNILRYPNGKPIINPRYVQPIDATLLFGFMMEGDEFGSEDEPKIPNETEKTQQSEGDEFSDSEVGGAARAAKYSNSWGKASLIEAVDKFAPDAAPVTKGGKIIYKNEKTGVQVVYDVGGNYFRIQNTRTIGKRPYLDLDGANPTNKIRANGSVTGRSQGEYNQVTHFSNND